MKKKIIELNLMLRRDGWKRSDYLCKKKVFKEWGNNNFYQPISIPSEPFLIKIHNNVRISKGVSFITHDIICDVFNNEQRKEYIGPNKSQNKFYMGIIEIFDNVMIGANSVIMYNIKIGPNAIVAAGSVVTKDVPPFSIVGGNPAKVIGNYQDLKKRREMYTFDDFDKSIKEIEDYFWGES